MDSRSHGPRLALLAAILLAFALRVYHLDRQSLWYDEGVTATIAQFNLPNLTQWTAADIQPPLYYYLVAGWGRLAGWSEWSVRFPSVFWGVLTVPLMAVLARLLARTESALLLAALFTSIHPLFVYYSQEARMYTMLTALGVLLGVLLVRTTGNRGTSRWRTRLVYIIVATAAIYTHYFAFFLLLAFGLWFLVKHLVHPKWPHGNPESPLAHSQFTIHNSQSTIHQFFLTNFTILILYVPWFAVMVTRLAVDASYWQGRLKVLEALRKIAITFTSGEAVFEAPATWLLIPYGLITSIALVRLLWQHRSFTIYNAPFTVHHFTFLLLWLTIPITAIVLLAAFVPKFNARYVMIALPGLLLFWSVGFGNREYGVRNAEFSANALHTRQSPILPRIGRVVCVIGLLIGFGYGDGNWFFNTAFTKSQWREFSRYLRERIEPTEQVILVSGHAWPVWDYYAPDMPAARLPALRILDVEATLDYANSIPLLQDALKNHHNAWLVLWQDEVVDPMGVVPLHLAQAGEAVPHATEFWRLNFLHFAQIDTDSLTASLPNARSIQVNFGNQVLLREYSIDSNGDLLLLWQMAEGASPLSSDLQLALRTTTTDGLPYHNLPGVRPAGYLHPTTRWQPEQLLVGRLPAQEWAGPDAVPGDYRLNLTVYDPSGDLAGLDVIGDRGQPLGKQTTLEATLAQPPLAQAASPPTPDTVQLAPALLARADLPSTTVENDQPIALRLWWTVQETPTRDLDLFIGWRRLDDQALLWHERQPVSPAYPLTMWPAGVELHTVHKLTTPDATVAPPGLYTLEIGLAPSESAEPVGDVIRLPLTVEQSRRSFALPEVAQPVNALFGHQIRLHGRLEPLLDQVLIDAPTEVILVWQAETPPAADYTVTLQWLDADGKPARQIDAQLPAHSSTWLPQQVEIQPLTMAAPDVPGDYRLIVAVYDAGQPEFPRLLTAEGADHVEIGRVHVAFR